ncbi:hypothetical protein GE21DRAFT_1307878 [Neurospora crassa]|nr:hypothetical protein B8B20.200 [imported] - Neurospora crassa [Neurospora crassa]KHE85263.1 hypothetical protein GE21DRAFT_1307878 [Neurospora crassa]
MVHISFTKGCDYVIRNVHNGATKRAQTQLWQCTHYLRLTADGLVEWECRKGLRMGGLPLSYKAVRRPRTAAPAAVPCRKMFDFYWRPDLGKKGSQAGQVPTPAGARGYHRVANFILSPDLPYGTNIVQRLSYSGGSTTITTRTRHSKMEIRLQFKQAPNSR